MRSFHVVAMAGLALASSLSSTARASHIPSDSPTIVGLSFCPTVGGACPGSSLPASNAYRLETALTGTIYVYSDGLISLNAPLPAGAEPTKPATLGSSFLAPGLIPSGHYDRVAAFFAPCKYDPRTCAFDSATTNSAVELLLYTRTSLVGVFIEDLGPSGASSMTRIGVSFDYGSDGPFPSTGDLSWTDNLSRGSIIGYNVGGQQLWGLAPSHPGNIDYGGNFDVSKPGGPLGGVPEPAAWALMIAGFALVGAAMRRDTDRQLEAV